jgi:nicotinamidase-related amidase
LPALRPLANEPVLEKDKASAFSNSALEVLLEQINAESLFIVGFTANECIDATAKDSNSLGFVSYVVGDATAVFDMRGPDGKLIKAERLHKLTLANIHAYSATVIQTQDV